MQQVRVGKRGNRDSYGQWTFVKGNHSWWGWEWYCLSTGVKELKVLWCSRDCSLMLIYHGSSARRRDLYRTQPGNSDATGTCSLGAELRSWGGEARGEFFSFTCKSEHSDRHKDAETLGPCHCIAPSRIRAGGTLGHVWIWVQELEERCPRGVLPRQAPVWPDHSSQASQVPALRMGQETTLHSPSFCQPEHPCQGTEWGSTVAETAASPSIGVLEDPSKMGR